MKVKYLKSANRRLIKYQIYEVLGIEADFYRILNNDNEPCLYNPKDFEIIDPIEPSFWESKIGEDGERYAYPIEWNQSRFFESYHDRVASVVDKFWIVYRRLFS